MHDGGPLVEEGGFEVFNPQTAPRTARSLVTVKKRGALSLNEAAYGFLSQPEAVELLFNRTERVIGIRLVSPTSPRAHRVRKQRGRSYAVSARAFLNYYGIMPEVSVRYVAHQRGNMVTVDLKEEGLLIEPRTERGAAGPGTSRTGRQQGSGKTPALSRHKGSVESR